MNPRTSTLLPLPLKVRAGPEKRNALVHDRLADPEVVVDPLLDARRLGELLGLDTGSDQPAN
jgi:hypothetical protein